MPRASCRSSVMAALVEVCASAIERLRGIRVGVDLLLREAEGHADRHQPRLHAVVEVALDAGALDVGGADGAGALDARRAGGFGELRLAGGDHDRPRQDAVQDARARRSPATATSAATMPTGTAQASGTSMPVRASGTELVLREQRGEGEHDARSRDADEDDDDPAEDGRDRRALATPRQLAGSMACSHERAQESAEAGAAAASAGRRCARPKSYRPSTRAVSNQPSAEDRVDEGDEEEQRRCRGRGGGRCRGRAGRTGW